MLYITCKMKLFKTFLSEFTYFIRSLIDNIPEWIATFCLGLCAIIIAITIEPNLRFVNYSNFNLRYPYKGETLPIPVVGIIIIILPCFVLGILCLIYPRKMELALALMSFSQAMCLCLLITEALKVTVSRPRPNYYDYCGYNTELKKCTNNSKFKKDAKMSFPSGHSANAFCAGTWMFLFLNEFLQKRSELWFLLLRMIPIFIAIFVSITRIIDNMHHVSDVVAGALLGIGTGTIFFTNQHQRIFMHKKKREDGLDGLLITEDEI